MPETEAEYWMNIFSSLDLNLNPFIIVFAFAIFKLPSVRIFMQI